MELLSTKRTAMTYPTIHSNITDNTAPEVSAALKVAEPSPDLHAALGALEETYNRYAGRDDEESVRERKESEAQVVHTYRAQQVEK